jgi:hypothetical protein
MKGIVPDSFDNDADEDSSSTCRRRMRIAYAAAATITVALFLITLGGGTLMGALAFSSMSLALTLLVALLVGFQCRNQQLQQALRRFAAQQNRADARQPHPDGIAIADLDGSVADTDHAPLQPVGGNATAIAQGRDEAEIRRHEQEFRALVEHTPDEISRIDASLRYIYANPALLAATGRTAAEIIGKTPHELGFLAPGGSPWLEAIHKVFTHRAEQRIEFSFPTPDGRRTYESRLVPEFAPDGSVASVLEIARDITDRKQAEEQRRLLDAAMQTIDESIMITEADLGVDGPRIVYVNAGFTRLTGYTPEEAIGQTPRLLQGPLSDHGVLDPRNSDLRLEERYNGEMVNYHKDGSQLLLEWHVVALRDDSGVIRYWVANQRDVTERRRRAEVQRERQKLESLGVLAGGIAHDFNNLLGIVLGNAQLALLDLPDDAPARTAIEPIIEATHRATELTRQMLAYSGGGAFVVQPLDISAAIERMMPQLQEEAGSHTTIQFTLDRSLPFVSVDINQIRQLLRNLVRNAAEAIGEEGGIIAITTSLSRVDRAELDRAFLSPDLPEGMYVTISISDTGGGVDPAILSRIFEPFFSTRFIGRGLGLPAALGIVRGHQGAIRVENQPGHGVTFVILLPAVPDLEAQAGAKLVPNRLRVLVIDGDEAIVMVTKRMLEHAGYAVLAAHSCDEGVQIASSLSEPIDCVLLDAALPDLAETQILARLEAIRPALRVILMSGYGRADALANLGAPETIEFLQKPFTASDLYGVFQQKPPTLE